MTRTPIKHLYGPGSQILGGGRDVRLVPANWEHPRNDKRFIPLGEDFTYELEQWKYLDHMWSKGYTASFEGSWIYGPYVRKETVYSEEQCALSWGEIDNPQPQPEHYMPVWDFSEHTHFQYYETVTSGTPCGKVVASIDELTDEICGGHSPTDEVWIDVYKRRDAMVKQKKITYEIYELARPYIQALEPIPDEVWEKMRPLADQFMLAAQY